MQKYGFLLESSPNAPLSYYEVINMGGNYFFPQSHKVHKEKFVFFVALWDTITIYSLINPLLNILMETLSLFLLTQIVLSNVKANK